MREAWIDRGAEPVAHPAGYAVSLRRRRDLPVKTVYPGHYRPVGRERMIELIDILSEPA